MRLVNTVAIWSLCLFVASSAHGIRSADTHFFHDSFGDLQEELATAVEHGQFGVLVMFETNDCPWCERMKKEILNREPVQDFYREHFRIVTVNIEGDVPIVNFDGREMLEKEFSLNEHRVRATPVFIFFDRNGEPAARFTGAARNVQEFMWLGEFVTGRHYEAEKFSIFKRRKRAQP